MNANNKETENLVLLFLHQRSFYEEFARRHVHLEIDLRL